MVQISVVIPLYNKVNYIAQAISSIMNQTIQDFEIVIVNDGSTDGSELVVLAMTDPRIKVLHQKNAGAGAARNTGIRESSSDFIAFLDADDEWEPDHLEVLLSLRTQYPEAGLFATAYKIITRNNKIKCVMLQSHEGIVDYFEPIGFFKIRANYVHTSSCAAQRSVFEKIGYFNTINKGQDVDLFSRIALEYDVVFSPAGFSTYRLDRAEIATKRQPPIKGEYDFNGGYLSNKLLEQPLSLSEKYFSIRARSFVDKRKNLLDYLWVRQISFIALFIFWGYRRQAFSLFFRTLRYYQKLPGKIRITIALFFFLALSVFPSKLFLNIYNMKNKLIPVKFDSV
jgi:glycosyltransferase involved in cell wall biosynthesis